MGVRLSELVAAVRPVVAKFAGAEINVTYRMRERSIAAVEVTDSDSDDDHPWIVRVIESWDITDDDGTPIPVDLAGIKSVPIPVLNAITAAIYGDDGVGEAESNSRAG